VKAFSLLLAVVFGLGVQASALAAGPGRHLVYEFGYNTRAAKQGTGTGTETVDIGARADDGGVMITGTDSWWNTVRPRATNTCELYPSGKVACMQRPYALSPIQLTIFPLLARDYFKPLVISGSHATWPLTYTINAAVIPGASGFMGQPYVWNAAYEAKGEGPIKGAAPTILVVNNGKLTQQGGRYLSANDKMRIAYDPNVRLPVYVFDVRAHLPQTSVYNTDTVELKLVKN
jgi:hypothetical protein